MRERCFYEKYRRSPRIGANHCPRCQKRQYADPRRVDGYEPSLGKTAGNAVEVAEAVGYLKGEYRDSRLTEIVTTLGTEALLSTNLASSREDAVQKMQKALDGGHALEKFAKMVAALGGPADFTDDVQKYLPQAPVCRPVYAQSEGYLCKTDTRGIGTALIVWGGNAVLRISVSIIRSV